MGNDYAHDGLWDEITYPFRNFNGCNIEVYKHICNFTHTLLLGMWLFIPCYYNDPYWDWIWSILIKNNIEELSKWNQGNGTDALSTFGYAM